MELETKRQRQSPDLGALGAVPQQQSRGRLINGRGAVEVAWTESPGKRPRFGKCPASE